MGGDEKVALPDPTLFHGLINWYRGGETDSLLQRGQRPGIFRRVLFLKEKPHSLQEAGSMINFFGCADLAMC